jgi:hypothetical protein
MLTNDQLKQLMYHVMIEINNTSAPIVFLGAMVLQHFLKDMGFTKIDRQTRDIDCNWIGHPPKMDDLLELVTHSIREFEDIYSAKILRNYNEETTACIGIFDNKTLKKVFKIDIGVFPVLGEKKYYYGKASFRGILPNEMICDKIFVLSSNSVLKRVKDVLDVYLLANCISIDTDSIFFSLKKKSMLPLLSFDAFLNHSADLEHAYKKMQRYTDVPNFKDVYAYVKKFMEPFISNSQESLIWDNQESSWKENPDNDTLRPRM